MTNPPPPSDLPPVPELPASFTGPEPQVPEPQAPESQSPASPSLPPLPHLADPDAAPAPAFPVSAPAQAVPPVRQPAAAPIAPAQVAPPVRVRSAVPAAPARSAAPTRPPSAAPRAVAPPEPSRRRRNRTLLIGAVVVAALLVASVSTLAIASAIGSFTTVADGLDAAPADPEVGVAEPDAVETVPALFGQTVTYDNGMQIAVSEPLPFTPSAEATGLEGEANLSFTVTIYNGTGADYELFPFTLVTADGEVGSAVVDDANSMTGVPPVATLAAGQSVTTVEGYSFSGADAASGAVVYEVAPGPEYLSSRFAR